MSSEQRQGIDGHDHGIGRAPSMHDHDHDHDHDQLPVLLASAWQSKLPAMRPRGGHDHEET